jgi:menaquinone-dependent protoporphyrinogen oxidase
LKVLIVYASKTGFTKGIAESIGDKLRERAFQVDIQEAGAVRDPRGYDAYVIGSALYMFHWIKEAKEFVSKNRSILAGKPVWLFSSGPVGTKPTNPKGQDLLDVAVSGPKELDELRKWVNPRDHKVFFGGLDGSKLTGSTGFMYRLVMKSESARESMPEGDFRDWTVIEVWANGIADALQPPVTPISTPAG